jgi:uncharacterized protein (TIGR03437 family)
MARIIDCVSFALLACALSAAKGQTRYFINTVAGSNPIGDNGPATRALLWNPIDVAVDAQFNVYIADTLNNRIRKITPQGVITTIACTGAPGDGSGDGGPATQAACLRPNGITVDAAGNVYFSDVANSTVRKIGLNGMISRVAGGAPTSFLGDGGPATAAALSNPGGLAFDASGNLYIADSEHNSVRRVSPNGTISTIAGTGYCNFSGDNGPPSQAALCNPRAVAVDPQGRVLVADTINHRIRRFAPGGLITTIAGGSESLGADDIPATEAGLTPVGLAVDKAGNIYIADASERIRVVNTSGIIYSIAGAPGVLGFQGDGAAASSALLNNPYGLAVDALGNVYIADTGNNRVRTISLSQIINTIAGATHYSGDSGPAVSAVMFKPSFVTLDNSGNLLVSDQDNHVVRKIDASGKITTIAGTGAFGSSGDGGPATAAQLWSPQGLAVDSAGNLYIADPDTYSIRMVTPAGTITKIAGSGKIALGDGGPALQAAVAPQGIALDNQGNIYLADTNNNRIRRIAANGIITTLIGDGTAQSTGDGGLATSAQTYFPTDVKVASDGTVYFTEPAASRVRKISRNGIVSTVAVLPAIASGLALDHAGNMIVSGLFQITSLTPSGSSTTLAGGNEVGFAGDGGPALQAMVDQPLGLVTDAKGNIYFCDQWNNRVRELTPDTVSQLVLVSGNQQTGPLGALLPLPLVVQATDSAGIPFPGATVNFAITSGRAMLSTGQTTTGPDGKAGVTLALTGSAGIVTVTATIAGLPPVTFTATAVDVPAFILILGGNNQTGVAGSILPQVLEVEVLGGDGKAIPGVPVAFAVTNGSATLNPASMETAYDGSAYTQVTLGNTGDAVTISATVTGVTPVTFTITATPANGPQISAGGVVSAGLSTPPLQTTAPNAIVSIFGKNFAPAGTSRSVTGADLTGGLLPTNLAGVCVVFGATRAPIFLITPGQLNVQTPQVSPGATAVQVITGCDTPAQVTSSAVTVMVQQASPEFFYASTGLGTNPVAATDAVSGAGIGDPIRLGPGFALAYPGETVTIYATGLGLTTPPFAPGHLPPGAAQVNNVSVSIDGAPVNPSAIQYAGVTPLSAGLYQLNILLPASLTNGDHTIAMTVSGPSSPAGYISAATR